VSIRSAPIGTTKRRIGHARSGYRYHDKLAVQDNGGKALQRAKGQQSPQDKTHHLGDG
jgi:hypothetical protein